jgi:hypothetical protein
VVEAGIKTETRAYFTLVVQKCVIDEGISVQTVLVKMYAAASIPRGLMARTGGQFWQAYEETNRQGENGQKDWGHSTRTRWRK